MLQNGLAKLPIIMLKLFEKHLRIAADQIYKKNGTRPTGHEEINYKLLKWPGRGQVIQVRFKVVLLALAK